MNDAYRDVRGAKVTTKGLKFALQRPYCPLYTDANVLQKYFPIIRTRGEVLKEINGNDRLLAVYQNWNRKQQELFLDYCSGQRGVRILYDTFFKEILNPDITPERVEELLSLILKQKVKILKVLPLESPRLGDEQSLIVMDVVVELEDHSIANLEVQKAGYYFPGQRAACYSSDLLLRQYKRVREDLEKQKKCFSYWEIKKVYTLILYEKSPKEFHAFSEDYLHRFSQKSDTGIEIDLLQEYIFISLDIFHGILHNNGNNITNKLEAWLVFLSMDKPEMIEKLIREYPQFGKYYKEIYELCRNTERMMGMFSKELKELDRNTVQYMIDDMQDEINAQKETIVEQKALLSQKDEKINIQNKEIEKLKRQLAQLQTETT